MSRKHIILATDTEGAVATEVTEAATPEGGALTSKWRYDSGVDNMTIMGKGAGRDGFYGLYNMPF